MLAGQAHTTELTPGPFKVSDGKSQRAELNPHQHHEAVLPRTSKGEEKERKGEREKEKKRRREGERRRQEMKRRKRKIGRLGKGLPQLRLSTPAIPALERLRRGDQESEDNLAMLVVVLVTGSQYMTGTT